MKIILCADPILRDKLKAEGIGATVFDTILNHEEKVKMLERLDLFASNWFLQNGEDFTEYRNVSIGAAIHDDVLTFFHMYYHFCLILEKVDYKSNQIIFYQSDSCLLPEPITSLLQKHGVEVITKSYSYPYLCFRKAFEKDATSRIAYTGIEFTMFKPGNHLGISKISLKQSALSLFLKLLLVINGKGKSFIYIWPWERLESILNGTTVPNQTNSNYSFLLPPSEIKKWIDDSSSKAVILKKLWSLSKNGVFFNGSHVGRQKISDPIQRWFHNLFHKNYLSQLKNLVQDYVYDKHLFKDKDIQDSFVKSFTNFYIYHLVQYKLIINRMIKTVKCLKINKYIAEYVNPFMLQVIADTGGKTFFIHVNRFANNQYFCNYLLKKIEGHFIAGIPHEFDRARHHKQGFTDKMMVNVCEDYYNKEQVKSEISFSNGEECYLTGKSALIIPPFLGALHTSRFLLPSSFLEIFFKDVISVLDRLGVARIIIRPHPGLLPINNYNYNYWDCYKHFCDGEVAKTSEVIIRTVTEANDLAEDLSNSDVVIGMVSAVAIDAAVANLDYIAYDQSITPFEETINYTVFSESNIIPKFSDIDSLYHFLLKYKASSGRAFIKSIGVYNNTSAEPLEEYINNFIYN